MTNPLRTAEDHELFLYTLVQQFPSVRRSTLTFVRLASSLARVAGELHLDHGIRLIVRERLLYDRAPLVIDWYKYEVWQEDDKLYWYDSQPHSNEPELQSTNPHHKHVLPDIKHHRIAAPDMSFTRPNLPLLIQEIEAIIENIATS